MIPAPPAVLLISPGILRWTDQDFGLPHLVALGSWLQARCGVRVEILDLGYEGADAGTLLETIKGLGPFLMIGLSCYSSFDYRRVMSVAGFLRAAFPDVPLVAGGYHASALPGDLVGGQEGLPEGSPFDAVIQGEGERPLERIVSALLGAAGPLRRDAIFDKPVFAHDLVEDINDLPPHDWSLLRRYWPRARWLGRRFQMYLSRGCPYHCTFCMERAKSGYQWRAFTPERAIDEVRRLFRWIEPAHWLINIADPLFGFQRRWRKEVLRGLIAEDLLPRQYWTLTRSDDLDEEDVELLARARFSIGIGLESGSPRMLKIMQKGNHPDAYLGALQRLAVLSRKHGLNWAANVIVGHPGEDAQSMEETHQYLRSLYLSAPETCGWLSVDPFRLYPGAQVHEELARWEQAHGARFHHPGWWRHWYDGAFLAQHIDPSASLTYEQRVTGMYARYGPMVEEIQARFRGQGRDIDRVFARSLDEQREQLSAAARDRLLEKGRQALRQKLTAPAAPGIAPVEIRRPLGLRVRDPWVRRREEAVRRLLGQGALHDERVIAALLEIGPEAWMGEAEAIAVLEDRPAPGHVDGQAPGRTAAAPGLRAVALGLAALAPGPGDRVADLHARSGYVGALLQHLTGNCDVFHVADLGRAPPGARLIPRDPAMPWELDGLYDQFWLGAAVPRLPRGLTDHLSPGGRLVTAIGPRFRDQDWVLITADQREHRLCGLRLPVLGGHGGWLPAPPPEQPALRVQARRWPAPARFFALMARMDLGRDAAGCYDAAAGARLTALEAAWDAAPGRLSLIPLAMREADPAALIRRLRSPPPALQDAAGSRLAALFADAMEREFRDAPAEPLFPPSAAALPIPQLLADALPELRRLLYEAHGAPPPLTLLHCPALGPRARATALDGQRLIAADLGQPPEPLLMQILHEEVHVVTDAVATAEWLEQRRTDAGTPDQATDPATDPAPDRDTRPGRPGYALHRELEEVALSATEALLTARAPGWLPAFYRWLEQFNPELALQPAQEGAVEAQPGV